MSLLGDSASYDSMSDSTVHRKANLTSECASIFNLDDKFDCMAYATCQPIQTSLSALNVFIKDCEKLVILTIFANLHFKKSRCPENVMRTTFNTVLARSISPLCFF